MAGDQYQDRTLGPWGKSDQSMEVKFNPHLHSFYRSLLKLRSSSSALNHGRVHFLAADDEHQMIVFVRQDEKETIMVALNRGKATHPIEVDLAKVGFAGDELAAQQVFTSTGFDEDQVVIDGPRATITLPRTFAAVWIVTGTKRQ